MDHAQVVRDYKSLRKVSFAMGKRLVEMLSVDDLKDAARELGMFQNDQIVLETQDESSVVMDYGIYNIFHDGRNAIDRMLQEEPPPEGSPEMQVLRAMKNSHYTILDVQEAIPGVGVNALDGPERTPILVVDIGFSKTAIPGMALGARILSPEDGWWMTSGAALPLNQRALKQVARDWDRHKRRHGREPEDRERARIVTRACIAAGTSRQIGYNDVRKNEKVSGWGFRGRSGSEDTAPNPGASSKVGRNDPCPCGSGKSTRNAAVCSRGGRGECPFVRENQTGVGPSL